MDRAHKLLAIGLLTLVIFNQGDSKKFRIIEGDKISDTKALPYQVSLQDEEGNFCGGGIIGERHVLTAAHCIMREDGTFYKHSSQWIVAGSADARHPEIGLKLTIAKIYVPKIYFTNNSRHFVQGDVAVIKIRERLDLRRGWPIIGKLSLPFSNFYLKEPSGKGVVSGFGSNQVRWIKNLDGSFSEESESDGKLRSAEARLMSNAMCVQMYAKRRKRPSIASWHMCAQVTQRDALHPGGVCTGDSGSPLVVHDAIDGPTVVGVLNASPPGCKENKYPSIYARVSAYRDFVQNAMRGRLTSDMRLSTRERRY